MPDAHSFSAADLFDRIRTKQAFYDFLIRLDFVLPDIKSSLCTTPFLTQCYETTLYCPKQSDVNVCIRVEMPSKDELRAALLVCLESNFTHANFG